MTDPDPLIMPFLNELLIYREGLRRLVQSLTDEELIKVYDLFRPENSRDLPVEFWGVSFLVRARIRVEQRRRAAAAEASLSGANA